MEQEGDTLTLRTRPKKTPSLNLSSCFHSRPSDYHAFSSSPSISTAPPSPPHFLSPSSWFRSTNNNNSNSIASPVQRKGRRRHSADFSYDPLSYSLNFDDGRDESSVRSLASLPRRRMRDLDLPPLIREGDKDDLHVPGTAMSAEATTTRENFVTLL